MLVAFSLSFCATVALIPWASRRGLAFDNRVFRMYAQGTGHSECVDVLGTSQYILGSLFSQNSTFHLVISLLLSIQSKVLKINVITDKALSRFSVDCFHPWPDCRNGEWMCKIRDGTQVELVPSAEDEWTWIKEEDRGARNERKVWAMSGQRWYEVSSPLWAKDPWSLNFQPGTSVIFWISWKPGEGCLKDTRSRW